MLAGALDETSLKRLERALDHARGRELLNDSLAGSRPGVIARVIELVQRPCHALTQSSARSLYDEAGVTDDGRAVSHVSHNARCPARHRLRDDIGETLAFGGRDQHVESAVDAGHVISLARPDHTFFESQRR